MGFQKHILRNSYEYTFIAAMLIVMITSASLIPSTRNRADTTQKEWKENPTTEKSKENRKAQSHARLTIEFTVISAVFTLLMFLMLSQKNTSKFSGKYGKKMQYFAGIFSLVVLCTGLIEVGMQPEPSSKK